jgi:copper transport protein
MVLVVSLLLAAMPSFVLAHAELLEASPEPGANYRWSRPTEVRLQFSQPLEPETSIRVLNSRTFAEVPLGEVQRDVADATVVYASLPEIASGLYTVLWSTVSVDGHILEGSYEFNVSPREPLVTLVVAATVLTGMGVLVFTRRAGPEDLEA